MKDVKLPPIPHGAADPGLLESYGYQAVMADRAQYDELIEKMRKFIEHATDGRISHPGWPLETLKLAHDAARKAALQSQDMEGAEVTAYALPGGISVERSMQRDGSYLWAVRDSFKNCLSKSGEWDYEPLPSSRTEEWFDQHRFSSAAEAIDHARRAEGDGE